MKKENTESTSEFPELAARLVKLRKEEEAKRLKANKKDNILFGGVVLLYLAIGILGILEGSTFIMIFMLSSVLWVVWVWMLYHLINRKDYVIRMQQELHKMELEELDNVIAKKATK